MSQRAANSPQTPHASELAFAIDGSVDAVLWAEKHLHRHQRHRTRGDPRVLTIQTCA